MPPTVSGSSKYLNKITPREPVCHQNFYFMAKSISTSLYDFCVFGYRLVIFILFGNPLSMLVINLLAPYCAAEFANNRNIFGQRIYAFYERHALKWHFHWAKYWMKLDRLSEYTVKQQINYLFKVAFRKGTEVEALKAMPSANESWPDAYEELFFKYGKKCLPLKHRDIVRREDTPKWYLHLVIEFMMQNVRLSFNALHFAIEVAKKDEKVRLTLKEYLASGKLNDAQTQLLVDGVFAELLAEGTFAGEHGHGIDLPMFGILTDYIRRYGAKKELVQSMKTKLPPSCFELVLEADKYYRHSKAVRIGQKDETKWEEYCKQIETLVPEAQKLMTTKQYAVYSRNNATTGHKLDNNVIYDFLHNRDDEILWRLIFLREPNHGLYDAQTHTLVVETETTWNKVYRKTFNDMFEKLRTKVTTGQELNEEEQIELFNSPYASVLAPEYFADHRLCPAAEVYMLSLYDYSAAVEFYIDKYGLSAEACVKMFEARFAPRLVRKYVTKYSLGSADVKLFDMDIDDIKDVVLQYHKRFKLTPKAEKLARQKGWI